MLTALSFGLCLAPKLFNTLANVLEWIAKHLGIDFLWHYLDDFITIGRLDSEECTLFFQLLINLCTRLGLPLVLKGLARAYHSSASKYSNLQIFHMQNISY